MAERQVFRVSGGGVTRGQYTTLEAAREAARRRARPSRFGLMEGDPTPRGRATIKMGAPGGVWATIETYKHDPMSDRVVKVTGGKAPKKVRVRFKKRAPKLIAVSGRAVAVK